MKAQLHTRPARSRLGQGRPVLRCLLFVLLSMLTGCSGSSQPEAEWATDAKIAGKALGLSHVSGLVIDDQFAYVTIGGTLADQQAGTSGYAGEVTVLDDGTRLLPADDDRQQPTNTEHRAYCCPPSIVYVRIST